MTKAEFKARWESDDDGGGLTFEDIADCYATWGLGMFPKIRPIEQVRYDVLWAAKVVDAEKYNPHNLE